MRYFSSWFTSSIIKPSTAFLKGIFRDNILNSQGNELWFDLSIEVSPWSYKDSTRNTIFFSDPSRRSPWSVFLKDSTLVWSAHDAWSLGRLFKMSRPRMRWPAFDGHRKTTTFFQIPRFSVRILQHHNLATPKISRKSTEFKSKTTEGFFSRPTITSYSRSRLQIHCFLSKSCQLPCPHCCGWRRHQPMTCFQRVDMPTDISGKLKGTPPMPSPPENRASTRPY